MPLTFSGGVHPDGNKGFTKDLAIEVMPASKTVYVPLVQHLGRPAVPVVLVGDTVKAGTLIAQRDGVVSGNIFSPISGVVKDIVNMPTATAIVRHIVIENDGKDEKINFKPLKNPLPEEIISRLEECGVVGMGGAGFPTSVKLRPTKPVDTLIINAAECEPYITCDYRILKERTSDFIEGCRYLMSSLKLSSVIIAIEDNKADAANDINKFIAENGLSDIVVALLKTKYPQGAEKQLIYATVKRKVPAGGLPADVGVIVNNVHTALSACYAVRDGVPLYKRIMTVSGDCINRRANIEVLSGTKTSDIIEYLGGLNDKHLVKMISGGPMMGFTIGNGEVVVTKTSGSLLLLSEDSAFTGAPTQCINCSKCAKACPMKLMPMYIDKYAIADDVENALKYGAKNCIECGSCAYICPAKRTLVQSIRQAKNMIRQKGL